MPYEPFGFMVIGLVMCLLSQAAAVHFFLRVYAYLRDGTDINKKGSVNGWRDRITTPD